MTSEIALLNRGAVALAADSALTVTYWKDGKGGQGGRYEERYSKGANKIFHVSKKYPVGAMTYAAANLQGVPWEIILKAYRDRQGDTPRNELRQYAEDLFDFITSDDHLFPAADQDKQLEELIYQAAFRETIEICKIQFDKDKKAAQKKTDIKKQFGDWKKRIDRAAFIGSVDWLALTPQVQGYYARVKARLEALTFTKVIEKFAPLDDIIDFASRSVFKVGVTGLQNTGLILAGYGENEYFPRLLGYRAYGVLLGKFLWSEDKDKHVAIGPENVSQIKPIAQAEMVNTFIHGASMDALVEIDGAFEKSIDEFSQKLTAAGHLAPGADVAKERGEALKSFREAVNDHLRTNHTFPLRNVVGLLSIPELAKLAETLISIESLKERVTRPTESVSGPIDVAVISKSDGFIWIKRKHYFDKELNPRYFVRTSD